MKGNKKILVVAVLLLLIAASYTTYAIYKTSVNASGNVTAANWAVALTDGSTPVTQNYNLVFGTSDCDQAKDGSNNLHVAEGKIAPGVVCTKTISVDATGTEVDMLLTAALNGTVTATKGGQAVATTGANEFTVDVTTTGTGITNGIIPYNAANKAATVTVTLTWGDTDDSEATAPDEPDTVNNADTLLAGATFTVPIKITAKQYLGS